MNQVYSAAGTFPLKIRESISTRFSGLIEYSATFLVEKGSTPSGFAVGTTIATSSGPVSIFPGVRYSRSNDNPFDEMEVTAYGQSLSSGGRQVYGIEVLELSKTFQFINATQPIPGNPTWTVYEIWRCQTVVKHSVLANTSTNYSDPSGFLDRTMLKRKVVGESPNVSMSSFELNIVWNEAIRDISRTNFGAWDEVAVMKGYVPEVS